MAGSGRHLAAALSVVAAVALVAGSCSGDGAGNDDGAGDALGDGSLGIVEVGPGEAIQIRAVLALSGDAESSGRTSEKAARLAVAHYGTIHGFDVHLGAPIDGGCSPEGGEQAGAEIAADADVIGVVGTTCSAAAATAAPLVTGANKVMISPSNTSPRLTSDLAGNRSSDHHEGYYRTADNDLYQARSIARFLHEEKGVDAVAAIHNGDAYTQSLAEAFVASFEELGGSVTGVGVVDREETDVVPTLTDLAGGSPQALFFPVSRTVGAAIVQQLPDVSALDGVLRLSGDGLLSDAFLGLEESEGMFLSGPNLSYGTNANESTGRQAADLLSEYEDAYGTAPEAAFWAHAYDAATLLLEAIEAASRPEGESLIIDLAGVREFLDGVSGYGGIIGPISCDGFGDCGVRRMVVVEHLDSGDPAATRSNTVYEYVP